MPESKTGNSSRDAEVDIATALGNPWRFRIVYAATAEPLSPSQFISRFGGEMSNVSRHFRNLTEWGYLEKVDTVTGGQHRGATMTLYRATGRAHLDTASSSQLSEVLRGRVADTAISGFLAQLQDAIESGTLDADVERHVTYDVGALDAIAFQDLSTWLDEVLARLPRLRVEAKNRLEESGETAIPTTIGLFSFRSPSIPTSDTRADTED
jgi:DNA-binding transcriptional ArsR family regulator